MTLRAPSRASEPDRVSQRLSSRAARERRLGAAAAVARAALVAIAGLSLAGCARNARLEGRMDEVARALVEAETQGALRCAPRELAIAQSQLEFARLEREQGDSAHAVAHLDSADENVRAAKLLSLPGRCPSPNEAASPSPSLPPPAE